MYTGAFLARVRREKLILLLGTKHLDIDRIVEEKDVGGPNVLCSILVSSGPGVEKGIGYI